MCEIYVQEVMALQYMAMIPAASKQKILAVGSTLLAVLAQAKTFRQASIPRSAWYFFIRPTEEALG